MKPFTLWVCGNPGLLIREPKPKIQVSLLVPGFLDPGPEVDKTVIGGSDQTGAILVNPC
jgi:hypothetical protein